MSDKTKKPNEFKDNLLKMQEAFDETNKVNEEIAKEIEQSPKKDLEKKEMSALEWILTNTPITQEQIDQWNETYSKKVYFISFTEDEYYAFRYLTRIEYKDIVKTVINAQGLSPIAQQELNDELIVQKCLLYPQFTTEFKTSSPAGTIESLAKAIRVQSNFLNDEFILSLVVKL